MRIQKIINISLEFLKQGKIILYPTDTVWGIGCDATDEKAVKRVFEIKKRTATKSMIILVDSLDMLQTIIEYIPPKVLEILKEEKRPTSIIYENPIGLAKNVIAVDNTVAIRIVQNEFCQHLIHKFGKPIVSTSANISGTNTPKSFSEIDKSIPKNVDYVVALQQEEINTKSSRILKITKDGSIQTIRD